MAETYPPSSSRLRSCGIDFAIACLSAGLLVAALEPLGQFYLAWIGLVPLFWRLHSVRSTRRAALLAYTTGVIYFLLGFHWLFFATRYGYLVAALFLSLYWAIAGALTHRVRTFKPIAQALSITVVWTAAEFLRGTILGGFPWLNLGHSQTPFLLICQIVDVTGVAGVTAWIVLVNAALAQLLIELTRTRQPAPSPGTPGEGGGEGSYASMRASPGGSTLPLTLTPGYGGEGTQNATRLVLVTGAITAALVAYGWWRIASIPENRDRIDIALVQSNHVHTREGARIVKQQDQIDYLLAKSSDLRAAIIAWPETTMPPLNVEARTEPGLGGAPLFNRTLSQLSELARDRDAMIVTGGYYVGGFQGEAGKRGATDIRNSVYVLSPEPGAVPQDQLAGRYDKIRLVPFAEYLPFQESDSFLHRVMLNFATAAYAGGYRLTPASERTVFRRGSVRFVTPICFEDTLAPLVRSFFKPVAGEPTKRADLILNISNDGWFNAAEKKIHLQIARFRSIEHRVPTARVSNTGQSAFIDSSGRVVSSLEPFTEGVLTDSIRTDPRLTPYTRFGEWFAWTCVVTAGIASLTSGLRPRRAKERS